MTTNRQNARAETVVPAFVLWGVAGIGAATIVNAALFVTTASFAFPPDAIAEETGAPINLFEVVVATVVGGVLAVGGYALLRRCVPSFNRAGRLYPLAALVLLLAVYGPFTIHNVGSAQIVVMQMMHIVTGMLPLASMLRSEQQ